MNMPMMNPGASGPDTRYDRITRVAAMSMISPVAMLSLIDPFDDAVRVVSVFGADPASVYGMTGEFGTGLLRHALAVDDARLDARFHDATAGCLSGAVAYCNVPLTDALGAVRGRASGRRRRSKPCRTSRIWPWMCCPCRTCPRLCCRL